MIAPKPASRPRKVPFWRYLRLFRDDILSSQPAHLYSARMALFRTPFFRSALINEPDLIDEVLKARPAEFPKSMRVAEGLSPLLGAQSVFLTNGATWQHQRRIIDPAFEGGRLRDSFDAMLGAARSAAQKLEPGVQDIEPVTSRAAADVIFRTLFSIPIEDKIAAQVFHEFRSYQRAQPLLNLGAFLPLPRFVPRGHGKAAKQAAHTIRALITELTVKRRAEIDAGTAPDDLATRLMTTPDAETGQVFSDEEMVDQLAIFFLAGHETSASALAWALYLLACNPDAQNKVQREARTFTSNPSFSALSKMPFTRDVLRETLRLYPPVPMMVRETTRSETFRERDLKAGTQIVISPWHLQRNPRHWAEPDSFDPARWGRAEEKSAQRAAYLPFSNGPRVCPGAGFAMIENTLLLALLLADHEVSDVEGAEPIPVAHLTVRGRDGIRLNVQLRPVSS